MLEHVNGEGHGRVRAARRPARRKPLRMTRERRDRIEAAVDALIRILDELEGDPDLEPSISLDLRNGVVDGEEGDDNGIGDQSGADEQLDGEPSLGWTDMEARSGRYPDGYPCARGC